MLFQFKSLQLLTVFLLCFSFVFTPLSSSVALAQEMSIEEQLALLSLQLVELGTIIMNSPDIPDEERLVLMQQLVLISEQIIALQQMSYTPPPPPPDMLSAKDADLEAILVEFNPKTNLAKTTINIKGKDVIKNYDIAGVREAQVFSSKTSFLRQEIIKDISATYNVVESDVKSLLWLTARDPIRDGYVVQNSTEANKMLERFSLDSIINKIVVAPGFDVGSIEFFTDQDESLKLSLLREFEDISESDRIRLNTYTYTYEYFVSTDLDGVFDQGPEGEFIKKPKILSGGRGVDRNDIEDEIISMFNQLPFTSQVPNFDQKVLNFLTENPTFYQTTRPADEADLDCYSNSDKVLVTEFLRYLASGLTSQYEEVEGIVNYIAPQQIDPEGYGASCERKTRFF